MGVRVREREAGIGITGAQGTPYRHSSKKNEEEGEEGREAEQKRRHTICPPPPLHSLTRCWSCGNSLRKRVWYPLSLKRENTNGQLEKWDTWDSLTRESREAREGGGGGVSYGAPYARASPPNSAPWLTVCLARWESLGKMHETYL